MGLPDGANFGPYRIMGRLGRGGMASVYRAYEAGLDRYVALKVLPAESVQDESSAERFRREAKVIARLEHPNITPIFAYGIDDGVPWMAMRLIPGGSLSGVLKGQRLPFERSVAILRGVADALDYAHGKGVIHRDIKPQNVLLDDAGHVYLADFGIARLTETATVLTAAGLITGTPQYMAPEQAMGRPIDSRADIYALGVMAYEMLIGRVPFAADTPVAVLMKHVNEPIPVPSAGEVPEPLVRPLLKALAKGPDDRWPLAGDFVRALEQGMADARAPVVPVAPPPAPPTWSAPPVTHTGPVGTFAGTATSTRGMPTTQPGARVPTVPGRPPAMTPPTWPAPPRLAELPSTVVRERGADPAPAPPPAVRSLLPMVLAGAGLAVAIAVAAAVFIVWRGSEEASVQPSPGASPLALPTTAPATTAPVAPLAAAVIAPDPPPTAAPRAVPTPVPAVPATLPMTRREATPPTTAVRMQPPTAPPPPVTGSLRLDVDAVQPTSGEASALLYLQIRVDERPLRTLTLTFDGRDAFARARKRQAFEVPGVPVGARRIALVASRSVDLTGERAEGATEMNVEEGVNRAYVQVRFMGGRDMTVRFR